MDMFMTPDFWVAVAQIIMIDILLGGDNAVVIALACRRLPPAQRTRGILWGTAGAIVLRIVLIFFALQLLAIPFLKIAGALLLVWIGVKLLTPEHDESHANIESSDKLWGAVKTVIVADFVMSVDNVIAIAGAAEASGGGQHSMALVIFGVLVSIPIIVWGSQLVMKLMDRFPIIITAGAMLLGWIAGTMLVTDPALLKPDLMPQLPKLPATDLVRYSAGAVGALLVLALGKWMVARSHKPGAKPEGALATPLTGQFKRVLLPVDDSPSALRAVQQVLALRQEMRSPDALVLHLLNVQRPVSGDVVSFVGNKSVEEYHDERSAEALAPARAMLQAANCPFQEHRRVGVPGATIAAVAQEQTCDLIVMGTRGLSSPSSALLGSVAQGVLERAQMPVLLTR